MMAILFIIYLFCFYLIMQGKQRAALYLATINLFFCALMLMHHATSTLGIRV